MDTSRPVQRNGVIEYSSQLLLGTNKVGTLKKMDGGYREVILGGLNVHNFGGKFYALDRAVREIFENSSGALQRRIHDRALRGENGHPRRLPGMTKEDWFTRLRDIYEPNVCVQIRRIRIDENLFKNANGEKVYTILGEVIPSGSGSVWLEKQFENPDENVCFSIRSFTENRPGPGGQLYAYVREVNTWDCVNEPGIGTAKKFNCPTLESIDSTEFGTADDLRVMAANIRASVGQDGVSNEAVESNLQSLHNLIEVARPTMISVPAQYRW